jgi:hypothetical protein
MLQTTKKRGTCYIIHDTDHFAPQHQTHRQNTCVYIEKRVIIYHCSLLRFKILPFTRCVVFHFFQFSTGAYTWYHNAMGLSLPASFLSASKLSTVAKACACLKEIDLILYRGLYLSWQCIICANAWNTEQANLVPFLSSWHTEVIEVGLALARFDIYQLHSHTTDVNNLS